MTDAKKVTALASARRATPKNLVERAMAGLEDVAATECAVAPLTDAMRAYWRAQRIGDKFEILQAHEPEKVRVQLAFLRQAAFGETNPVAVRAMFALMLDAVPAAKNFDSATYVDALVSMIVGEPSVEKIHKDLPRTREVGGFTNIVVARAVRRIWRTATFTPSIAEVLLALREERENLHNTIATAERFLQEHEKLQTPERLGALRREQELEALERKIYGRAIEEERREREERERLYAEYLEQRKSNPGEAGH